MIVPAELTHEHPKGVYIYCLDPLAETEMEMPDMMKTRLYGYGNILLSVGDRLILPKLYDVVEFDTFTGEWYINVYQVK